MIAIATIAALATLVWATYFSLRGSIISGCIVYLVIRCCFGQHFLTFDVANITLSLDRLFLVGLIGAFFVQWRLGRTEPKRLLAGDYCLLVLTLLLIVSTFTHQWNTSDLGRDNIVQQLIVSCIVPFVVYWISRQACLNEKNVSGVLICLALFGVYLSITAVAEFARQWAFVFPRYIANPDIGIHFGRARGPMLHSASFGTYLVICMLAMWIIGIWQGKAGRIGQTLAIAATPLFLAATAFTYTRSVWLGAILGGAVLIGLILKGRWRPAFIGATLVAGLLVGITQKDNLVSFKREYSAAETRESTYMRASFAYVSLKMFQDQPFWGHGFGQYIVANKPYLTDQSTSLRLESIRDYSHHSTFLRILVELGLTGFVTFIALLGCWTWNGWQLFQRTDLPCWMRGQGLLMLTAMIPYAFQLLFHHVISTSYENILMYLIAGISSGLLASVKSPAAEQLRSPLRSFAQPTA